MGETFGDLLKRLFEVRDSADPAQGRIPSIEQRLAHLEDILGRTLEKLRDRLDR